MAIWGQKSNRWREYCNPLRGLSLQRLMSLLDAGERGEYSDLQWLYHFMEKSDPVIFSVLQRRRAALLDCDWDVRVVAPTGEPQRGDERTTDSHGWTRMNESGGAEAQWRERDVSRQDARTGLKLPARRLRPVRPEQMKCPWSAWCNGCLLLARPGTAQYLCISKF